MRFIDAQPGDPVIRGLSHQLDEDRCTLRWQWPEGIQAVYIGRAFDILAGDAGEGVASAPSDSPSDKLRLYTRNEYKANNGYHDRIEGVGRVIYTVYASVTEQGDAVLFRQPDGANRAVFSTGKARVTVSIREKGGWLQKFKTVEIRVTTEVPIPKEALCYVKKQGSYPAHKEDGTVYPFVMDFAAGKNVLPAIEVGKNDYVRLFFTDGKKYGQLYELVQGR